MDSIPGTLDTLHDEWLSLRDLYVPFPFQLDSLRIFGYVLTISRLPLSLSLSLSLNSECVSLSVYSVYKYDDHIPLCVCVCVCVGVSRGFSLMDSACILPHSARQPGSQSVYRIVSYHFFLVSYRIVSCIVSFCTVLSLSTFPASSSLSSLRYL